MSVDIVLLLREARRRSGLSQKEAAKLSGVGEKSISSFETGRRASSISVEQLLALIKVYGLTPEQVFSSNFLAESIPDPGRQVITELAAWVDQLPRRELDACAELLRQLMKVVDAAR